MLMDSARLWLPAVFLSFLSVHVAVVAGARLIDLSQKEMSLEILPDYQPGPLTSLRF